MNKTLLVSLISDQTIPNIQMIKEVKSKYINCDYLMITTQQMENNGIVDNIMKASVIENVFKQIVPHDSYIEIKNGIYDFNYSDYEKIIVNITGGTMMMMLAAYDYFKEKPNTEIYYISGNSLEYSQLYPYYSKPIFTEKISLKEYLTGYGFTIKETECSGISKEQTEIIFDKYCNGVFDNYQDALTLLRDKRNKGISKEDDFNKVFDFLKEIEYTPLTNGKLNKLEIKYLSGEWFEEYIGYRVKSDLGLFDDEILVGAKIYTNPKLKVLNSIDILLNIEPKNKDVDNEIDVMFIYKNSLYVIECKTSIINVKPEQKEKKDKNGNVIIEIKEKKENILGDTIYKSDALKTKFGLFAKSYIFTLTDFIQYIEEAKDKDGISKQMETLINRAEVSKIKLIDKNKLRNATNIKDLL